MSVPSSIHDPAAPEILAGEDTSINSGAGEAPADGVTSMSVPSSIHDPAAPETLAGEEKSIDSGAGEARADRLQPDAQDAHVKTADPGKTTGSSPDSIGKTIDAGKTSGGSFPANGDHKQ